MLPWKATDQYAPFAAELVFFPEAPIVNSDVRPSAPPTVNLLGRGSNNCGTNLTLLEYQSCGDQESPGPSSAGNAAVNFK